MTINLLIRLSPWREISPSPLFLFGILTDVINADRVQLTGSGVGGGADRHAPLLVLILSDVDLTQEFNIQHLCSVSDPEPDLIRIRTGSGFNQVSASGSGPTKIEGS
jgi:hypothetical protein